MQPSALHLKLKFGQPVWHNQEYVMDQTNQTLEMDFFDHSEAIDKALSILQEPGAHTPIIIIGERRAGKTSMLRLLLQKMRENKEQRFIGLEIPWLGIDSAARLMKELLDSLFLTIDPEDRELQKEILQVNSLRGFQNTMTKILKYQAETVVVYGLDELDTILKDQVQDPAGQAEIIRLINFLTESTELPIKLILSTTREPKKLDAGYQLTAKTERIRLAPFSKSDFDFMLEHILGQESTVNAQEKERVFALSGGWPHWAKALLYQLVQLAPGEQRLAQAEIKAIQSISPTWEFVYDLHWDQQQKALMLFIAQHGGQVSDKQIKVSSSFSGALHDLIERGYILHDDQAGYRFQILLLQQWLSQWPRFEEQTQKYRSLLTMLSPDRDAWADGDGDVVEITKEDIRQRGY